MHPVDLIVQLTAFNWLESGCCFIILSSGDSSGFLRRVDESTQHSRNATSRGVTEGEWLSVIWLHYICTSRTQHQLEMRSWVTVSVSVWTARLVSLRVCEQLDWWVCEQLDWCVCESVWTARLVSVRVCEQLNWWVWTTWLVNVWTAQLVSLWVYEQLD